MLDKPIIERMGPYQLLHHYLSASYCYYQLDLSPMTDEAFDRLCVRLLAALDRVKDDPHYRRIKKGDLEAGTCLIAQKNYPFRVSIGAEDYYNSCKSGQMARMLEQALPPIKKSTRIVRRTRPTPEPVVEAPVRTAMRVSRRRP